MTAANVYAPGRLLSASDVLDAVYDFILAYALPSLDAENVIRGWENRASLPASSQEYAVMTLIGSRRVGTDVVRDHFGANGYEEDEETIGTLRRIEVQIDFCSAGIWAGQRASCIEAVARSGAGVAFFRERGLSCLYAEGVTSVDYRDGTEQQVHRHIVTLNLAGWFVVSVTVPHAEIVSARIEDVDWHHPPTANDNI